MNSPRKKVTKTPFSVSARLGNFLERNSSRVILAALAITLLLIIPLIVMSSDEQASDDPKGEVFDLRDDIDQRFAPRIHGVACIAESRTGDILTQAALWELYQNEQQLRADNQRRILALEGLPTQSYLYEAFNVEANQSFIGVYSIADAVQTTLVSEPRFGITLENATDEHVKLALYQLFSNPATSGLRDSLSNKAYSEKRTILGIEIDYWICPHAYVFILRYTDCRHDFSGPAGITGSAALVTADCHS